MSTTEAPRDMALRLPTAHGLEALAGQLSIPLKDKGMTGPWLANETQVKVWQLLEVHPHVIVVKCRQEGITTAGELWLLALAITNPGQRFAIVLHKASVAVEKLAEIKGFCRQLGLKLPVNQAAKIQLPNGSEIHALGASGGEAEGEEANVGRGLSFAAALMSDVGYWKNSKAYRALKAAIGDGPILMEGTAQGPEGVLYETWEGDNDYAKHFQGVEQSSRCQLPPESIDDDLWADLQEQYGFKSRSHAAWWHKELNGGDVVAMLRDFPVRASDPWRVSDARWIHVDPRIHPGRVDEERCVVLRPYEPGLEYMICADVSYGTGADASAAWVLRRDTGQIQAYYYSSNTPPDAYAPKVAHLAKLYSVPDSSIVVERNGRCGGLLIENLWKLGIAPTPVDTNEVSKAAGLLAAKRAIESGNVWGPEELAAECKSLRAKTSGKSTRWIGSKDGLMALGIGLLWLEKHPWIRPQAAVDDRRVYVPSRERRRGRRRFNI